MDDANYACEQVEVGTHSPSEGHITENPQVLGREKQPSGINVDTANKIAFPAAEVSDGRLEEPENIREEEVGPFRPIGLQVFFVDTAVACHEERDLVLPNCTDDVKCNRAKLRVQPTLKRRRNSNARMYVSFLCCRRSYTQRQTSASGKVIVPALDIPVDSVLQEKGCNLVLVWSLGRDFSVACGHVCVASGKLCFLSEHFPSSAFHTTENFANVSREVGARTAKHSGDWDTCIVVASSSSHFVVCAVVVSCWIEIAAKWSVFIKPGCYL